MESKFKVGDKIRVLPTISKADYNPHPGSEGFIKNRFGDGWEIQWTKHSGGYSYVCDYEIELIETQETFGFKPYEVFTGKFIPTPDIEPIKLKRNLRNLKQRLAMIRARKHERNS